ncbi:MAG: hypothetical protein RR619_06295 [Raoultibacter sp.]
MVLAIVLGVVSGVLGVLPLIAGLGLAKKATSTSNLGHAGALLLGVLFSFVILVAALFACASFARESLLPFALAEIGVLVIAAIGFGVYRLVRK